MLSLNRYISVAVYMIRKIELTKKYYNYPVKRFAFHLLLSGV